MYATLSPARWEDGRWTLLNTSLQLSWLYVYLLRKVLIIIHKKKKEIKNNEPKLNLLSMNIYVYDSFISLVHMVRQITFDIT